MTLLGVDEVRIKPPNSTVLERTRFILVLRVVNLCLCPAAPLLPIPSCRVAPDPQLHSTASAGMCVLLDFLPKNDFGAMNMQATKSHGKRDIYFRAHKSGRGKTHRVLPPVTVSSIEF